MILQKFVKSIPSLIVAAIFVWTIYAIVSYDDYYYGEPLNGLSVVVKDSPKFSFDRETKISYYYFTTNEYKTEFRISEGAVELVRDSDSLTKKIEAIKSGDSVNLEIRQSDNEKLVTGSRKIRVIGLSINDKIIIDPAEVQVSEKGNRADRWFGYSVFFGFLIFIAVRGYLKQRNKNRTAYNSNSTIDFNKTA